MTSYLLRRLGFTVFVVWGALSLIFVILRLVPGDPAVVYVGPTATVEQLEAARERFGLDEPVPLQYLRFLGSAARLDFGTSYRLGRSASGLVIERLPASIELALASTVLAVVLGLPLGVMAAVRHGTAVDRVITRASLVGQSLPQFWVGLMLILVFARWLQWLPSAGVGSWQHLLLPTVSLALPFLSMVVRLSRSGLLDVLSQEYVRVARSKGLSERVVLYKHAVRNMLLPLVTVVGLQVATLIGGAVIVETVFAWPGVGRLLIDAVRNRDYPVIQAATAVIALVFVLLNMFVDVLYSLLDPRVRLEA